MTPSCAVIVPGWLPTKLRSFSRLGSNWSYPSSGLSKSSGGYEDSCCVVLAMSLPYGHCWPPSSICGLCGEYGEPRGRFTRNSSGKPCSFHGRPSELLTHSCSRPTFCRSRWPQTGQLTEVPASSRSLCFLLRQAPWPVFQATETEELGFPRAVGARVGLGDVGESSRGGVGVVSRSGDACVGVWVPGASEWALGLPSPSGQEQRLVSLWEQA